MPPPSRYRKRVESVAYGRAASRGPLRPPAVPLPEARFSAGCVFAEPVGAVGEVPAAEGERGRAQEGDDGHGEEGEGQGVGAGHQPQDVAVDSGDHQAGHRRGERNHLEGGACRSVRSLAPLCGTSYAGNSSPRSGWRFLPQVSNPEAILYLSKSSYGNFIVRALLDSTPKKELGKVRACASPTRWSTPRPASQRARHWVRAARAVAPSRRSSSAG
jgi:hypothetical protein